MLLKGGRSSCEGGSDASIGGSEVTDSPCAINCRHAPSCQSPQKSKAHFVMGGEYFHSLGRPLNTTDITGPDAGDDWLLSGVGSDRPPPERPEGNCHCDGMTARRGRAHMAILSGAIMPPVHVSGFIFFPSSSEDEVKERPCLNCWRGDPRLSHNQLLVTCSTFFLLMLVENSFYTEHGAENPHRAGTRTTASQRLFRLEMCQINRLKLLKRRHLDKKT